MTVLTSAKTFQKDFGLSQQNLKFFNTFMNVNFVK